MFDNMVFEGFGFVSVQSAFPVHHLESVLHHRSDLVGIFDDRYRYGSVAQTCFIAMRFGFSRDGNSMESPSEAAESCPALSL